MTRKCDQIALPAEHGVRKFGKWVSSKDAGGIISRRAKFHFVSRPTKKTQFLLCPERVIPCVHETFFHWFSTFGAVHSIPSCFSQNKTPLSQQRDKGDEKPLRYHSFCRGADTPAAQDCPVTGASGGAYCGSALCSKGMPPVSSRPPCTKRRLSVRLGGGDLSLSAHVHPICSISYPVSAKMSRKKWRGA